MNNDTSMTAYQKIVLVLLQDNDNQFYYNDFKMIIMNKNREKI